MVVAVSRTILMGILTSMHVWLSQPEVEQLYRELLDHFGLAGALNECQALENSWKDPYNKRQIEAWLKRKRRKKEEAITGLI